MSNEVGVLDLASLQERWQQWTNAIQSSVGHRDRLYRMDHQEYRKIHQTLLAACRAQVQQAEGKQKFFFQYLQDMASPWMSPETLASTDKDILQQLLARCRQAERELGCRKAVTRSWHWLALVVVALWQWALCCVGDLTRKRGRWCAR